MEYRGEAGDEAGFFVQGGRGGENRVLKKSLGSENENHAGTGKDELGGRLERREKIDAAEGGRGRFQRREKGERRGGKKFGGEEGLITVRWRDGTTLS